MSRGPGRIERAILAAIERDKQPDRSGGPGAVLVHSWGLTCGCYQDHNMHVFGWKPSRAQRKTVVQAMHSFVRKHPQYALIGGQGRRMLYLYEPGDPLSTLWAQLNVQRVFVSRSEAQTLLLMEAKWHKQWAEAQKKAKRNSQERIAANIAKLPELVRRSS